jgi:uncharacterized protein
MTLRIALLLILTPLLCLGQLAIPQHGGKWVHDETIRSLQGQPIEEYSLRVAEEWKLGKANKDNGVLLLVVVDDRELRIETGYGLEGVLTDALSSRINRNEIAPHLRRGDYDAGIKAGVTAIIEAIRGEYKNDDPPQRRKSSRRSPIATLVILIIIFIIASRRGRGGRGGGGYWSSGSGWVGPMGGFGGGSSGSSWVSGSDFGGGGGFGGGGSSDSW